MILWSRRSTIISRRAAAPAGFLSMQQVSMHILGWLKKKQLDKKVVSVGVCSKPGKRKHSWKIYWKMYFNRGTAFDPFCDYLQVSWDLNKTSVRCFGPDTAEMDDNSSLFSHVFTALFTAAGFRGRSQKLHSTSPPSSAAVALLK